MEFTIINRTYDIEKNEVSDALENVKPDRIIKYFIEIHGKQYPIKQVLARAKRIPRQLFSSKVAYDVLSGLGFEIKER